MIHLLNILNHLLNHLLCAGGRPQASRRTAEGRGRGGVANSVWAIRQVSGEVGENLDAVDFFQNISLLDIPGTVDRAPWYQLQHLVGGPGEMLGRPEVSMLRQENAAS